MRSESNYGVKCEIHMRCGSSAARGMSAREGWVKTRGSCGFDKRYRKDV